MNHETGKTALVVEGGGMRGIFSAGVLHAFGKAGFDPFDLYIGVSAGACNLASHLAGQNDRNYDIIRQYSSTKRFINSRRFLLGGHLMDLDWLWDVTVRECRLDLKRLFGGLEQGNKTFIVVATSMRTGRPIYLQPNEDTLEYYLKVSSAVPLFYRKILKIGSEAAVDGGVSDPIPVMEARRRGAMDITVIRTQPAGYVKKKDMTSFFYPWIFKRHPEFVEAMKNRPAAYMASVRFIHDPPRGLRVQEIAPPPDMEINRTSRGIKVLDRAYECGIRYGTTFMASYKNPNGL